MTLFSTLLGLTILFLLTSPITAFPWEVLNGFEFRAFDVDTREAFVKEAKKWQITNPGGVPTDNVSDCNGIYMLGGPQFDMTSGTIKRTISSLPSHKTVAFEVELTMMGSWVTVGTLVFAIDGEAFTVAVDRDNVVPNVCGEYQLFYNSVKIVGQTSHSRDSIEINIYGLTALLVRMLEESTITGSFGVRNLNLVFTNTTLTESSSCVLCDYSTDNNCPCQSQAYFNTLAGEDGQCTPCHENCAECFGPSEKECFSCRSDAFFKDGACKKCEEPCFRCSAATPNQCFRCTDTQLYQANGTCSSQCNPPLSSINNQLCKSPCESQDQPFSWNGTCLTTCPSPLLSVSIDNFGSYCKLPCNASQYLMPNGSCVSECNETMTKTVSALGVPQCEMNSSSSTSKLTSEEIKLLDSLGATYQVSQQAMQATSALTAVIGASNTAASTLAGFVKMFPYIRYMTINYPPRLQYMLDSMNSTLISFPLGPQITQEMQDQFEKYPLPTKFDEYQFHSSFLVNYWQTLLSLAILLGVIVAFSIISHLLKCWETISCLLRALTLVVKWNFFLMVFCTNFDGIVISASLELRTIHINSAASAFSFIFCIVLTLLSIASFGLAIYIIRDIRASKKNHSQVSIPLETISPEKKWQGFQIFFKGSKEDTAIRHYFIVPYLLRMYIFNIIIALLFDYPLTQAILIVLLSIFIVAYMLWKRPFVSKLVFVQHMNDETIILIVNICLLCFAVLDYREIDAEDSRETLGDVVIYCNIIFSMTSNVFLVCYLAVGFYGAYQTVKSHKSRGIIAWMVALLAPFEVGGMDLEVIAETQPSSSPSSSPSSKPLKNRHFHQESKYRIEDTQNENIQIQFNGHRSSIDDSPLGRTLNYTDENSPLSVPKTPKALNKLGSLDPQDNSTYNHKEDHTEQPLKAGESFMGNIMDTPQFKLQVFSSENASPLESPFNRQVQPKKIENGLYLRKFSDYEDGQISFPRITLDGNGEANEKALDNGRKKFLDENLN